jgi:5'-phosphate synthase pdxT subunit
MKALSNNPGQRRSIQVTKTEKQLESPKDPLLDPSGPNLDDDFLAVCGERNRRLVERFRAEEDAARSAEAKHLPGKDRPRIGVLAIQGDYAAHAEALAECGAEPCEVRKPDQLAGLDGLILPGGESTTVLKFLEKHRFFEVLEEFCGNHPVFGTCAGAILLAREVRNPAQRSLGILDAVVERNAYGRQIDSTILTVETALPGGPLEMVFIRAPRIVETGAGVQVLALREGSPALVRQGEVMAATFHPELSSDRRVHRLFVQTVTAAASK